MASTRSKWSSPRQVPNKNQVACVSTVNAGPKTAAVSLTAFVSVVRMCSSETAPVATGMVNTACSPW